MTLLPTSGSVEILQRLQEGKAVVGFVQGGTAQSIDANGLLSLGRIIELAGKVSDRWAREKVLTRSSNGWRRASEPYSTTIDELLLYVL